MTELHQDQLCFSFPAIEEELRRLTDAYVGQTLPKILAEDRAAAVKSALESSWTYRNAPAEFKKEATRTAMKLTAERIQKAFAETVTSQAALERGDAGQLRVEFQRTLRIPDDGSDYFLPPGLGRFPLRHIDDFEDRVPAPWLERGGVMMPMYQSEALWLNFRSRHPFALKVASGKINAITGRSWQAGLHRRPQDYLVLPEQPWLDGFAVEKGIIRQFVAMPLGAGYSVEEQLSGKAEFGGLQLEACPLKTKVHFEKDVRPHLPCSLADILPRLLPPPPRLEEDGVRFCLQAAPMPCAPMGLGAGGRMKQEIYADHHRLEDWDGTQTSRCFVHLCDALVWREITGENPPHTPATASEYARARLPWFEFYRDDLAVLEGSKKLAGVKSVVKISKEKGDKAVTGNDKVKTGTPVNCGPKKRPNRVREWAGK